MRSGSRNAAAALITALLLAGCGGGSGGNGGVTPSSTSSPVPESGVTCPQSGSLPSSVAYGMQVRRRVPVAATRDVRYVPGAIAVSFKDDASAGRIDSLAASLRVSHVTDLDFDALHVRGRILRVDPQRTAQAIAAIKALPGVQNVGRVTYRQRMTIVSNDPYYGGFGAPAPYFETATTPGQWDMHVINAQAAWNEVASSAPVVGSAAPIAIVDTGVDVTHPELSGGSIVRTRCFVTYPSDSAQTSGQYVTDTDGHGTNVAGIAAGDTDNGLGFAAASFDAKLMAYRIFPADPAGGCDLKNPPDQCFSDSADEASAIDDAVANGAKVISLSLGGSPPCSTADPEYIAVENAIAHNVVVVAAAGNGDENTGMGLAQLDCPAADPGVIAVGASAINDSVSNFVTEQVASYSNYLPNGGNGDFLVAPGGDPDGSNDLDELHWIEHIYSSTAIEPGSCTPDYDSSSSTPDCRIDIAGTSQATPHVAGAAALILAVKPSYTPAQVAKALCQSAADISDSEQGCGRLDAGAAVSYAQSH